MDLRTTVHEQVLFMGKTPGGCKLVIHNLLDNGRDIFQFMQLFNKDDINEFHSNYLEEINTLNREDEELSIDASVRGYVKLALEKVLILIEGEIKNSI